MVLVALVVQVVALGATGAVHVRAALPAGASKYVAISPFRLADTRGAHPYGFSGVDASSIHVDITHRAGVPSNATAAVVNVTMIGTGGVGYLTAYPSGTTTPLASTVNSDGPNRTIANLAHVKIGADGGINIRVSTTTAIAVDLVGVYVPVADVVADGRLVTLSAGAQRVVDTRLYGAPVPANTTVSVDLATAGVPQNATAAVVTVTAVGAPKGFWTAFSYGGALPGVSTLNLDAGGQTRAGQAIVPMLNSRIINVYTQSGGNLVVDVVGWFTGASDALSSNGLYVPNTPTRMLDTRTMRALSPWNNSTFELSTGSPIGQISAVAMNITATKPWDKGFVTAFPAGVVRPGSSNLNVTAWQQTIANHAIVRVSTRGVALFTSGGAHLIADIAGWYLGPPSTATQAVPIAPNYQPNKAVAVVANKIGLYAAVKTCCGSLDAIANSGAAATWSDLSNLATTGNVMLFGHRTTHGGIFRYINSLRAGDSFALIGSDGHSYNYLVTSTVVTSPTYSRVASYATPYPPITAQLVACSKPDGTPTSTSYRLVVTGRLVSVT